MKSLCSTIVILVIILTVGTSEEQEKEFYQIDESSLILKQHNPFESKKELWLNPTDGVLITTKTGLLVATRKNGTIKYSRYLNAIKHIVKYSSELKRADAQFIDPRFNEIKIGKNDSEELPKLPDDYPTVVYPEVMVVVTYDFFKKFDLDIWKIIPYLLSFWNSVDMRYRFLENPRYRLNIKQFVLEGERGVLSYIKNHTNSTDYISYNCLQDASAFWYTQKDAIPLNSYDIVLTMTKRMICSFYDTKERRCISTSYGYSYSRGACSILRKEKIVEKVAIIYDNGAYQGITTAAHEIGHLLGAHDDGYRIINQETNEKGPIHCSYEDAFIMTAFFQSSANIFSWSKCSREDMEKFIRNKSSLCLRNKPKGFNYPIHRFLPGKIMDADRQCQQDGAQGICNNVTSTCEMLQCYYTEEGCVEASVPIADGTECNSNAVSSICLYGHCVSEHHL